MDRGRQADHGFFEVLRPGQGRKVAVQCVFQAGDLAGGLDRAAHHFSLADEGGCTVASDCAACAKQCWTWSQWRRLCSGSACSAAVKVLGVRLQAFAEGRGQRGLQVLAGRFGHAGPTLSGPSSDACQSSL